jgi:hypothetical protein
VEDRVKRAPKKPGVTYVVRMEGQDIWRLPVPGGPPVRSLAEARAAVQKAIPHDVYEKCMLLEQPAKED